MVAMELTHSPDLSPGLELPLKTKLKVKQVNQLQLKVSAANAWKNICRGTLYCSYQLEYYLILKMKVCCLKLDVMFCCVLFISLVTPLCASALLMRLF